MMSKIFTKEDRYNSHKILGILCLIHYIYRFTIGFKDPSWEGYFETNNFNFVLISLHILLSLSSFMFTSIPITQMKKPMIWREFRLHNMIFSLRSILSIYIDLLITNYSLNKVLKITVLLSTFRLADVITKKYGKYNKYNKITKTTRTLPYWENNKKNTELFFKWFYTFAQHEASLAILTFPYASFCVMFPIQIASFLMTCVKKNYISTKTYHFCYFFSLIIPNMIFLFMPNFWIIITVSVILSSLRRKISNKYIIWIPTCIIYMIYF